MIEKLLLAITITFALNFSIGVSTHSTRQNTVVAQTSPQSVYLVKDLAKASIAKALRDRSLLRTWFQ